MKPVVIPNHVAIIPDGNRRWAREKGLPTFEGHKKGYQRCIEVGKRARKLGIRIMTFWAFSTENWKRTKEEVSYLMNIYQWLIDQYLKEALREKIRIIHLGRKDRLDAILKKKIINAEEKTKNFTKYYLAIGLDYGGQDEILRTIDKVRNYELGVKKMTREIFNKYLDTSVLPYPNPDLIIRTGGEKRLSGFLLWQSEYAELMFVEKYFPDFTADDFEQCINEYKKRQRRFGK